jgi:hypothetical protein
LTIRHNRIEDNFAYAKGGGVALFDNSGSEFFNDLIGANETDTGGGIYMQYCPGCTITNCTIARNEVTLIVGGIATYQFSYPIVRNTIVYENIAPQFVSLLSSFDDSFRVSYSDVEGGWEGVEVMDESPLFTSGIDGSYYLSQVASGQPVQSPVVNRGDVPAVTRHLDSMTTRTDQVGDVGIVDLGFHYYQNPHSGGIVSSRDPEIPSSITLSAYPNPFNSTTTIVATLPTALTTALAVYDILGHRVFSLAYGTLPAGSFHYSWSGTDNSDHSLASGAYFLCLATPYQSITQKIILLK